MKYLVKALCFMKSEIDRKITNQIAPILMQMT
jgi:hypothetical protein